MKKRLTFIVALVLLFTTVIVLPLLNVANDQQEDKTIYKSSLDMLGENHDSYTLKNLISTDNSDVYSNDDIVTVTAELDGKCLLDVYNQSKYENMSDFLVSQEGIDALADIRGKQNAFRNSLQKIIGTQNASDSKSAIAVMNSVSFKTTYGNINSIQSISGIKRLYFTKTFVPQASSESKATVQQTKKTDSDYNGGGTVIAVVDTGFDISHEAFSVEPQNQKYTKQAFFNMLNNMPLNASEIYGADFLYKNAKIIFAYDYADDDDEVLNEVSLHGTMTAGTAAGSNGKSGKESFTGSAPEAQLMLMKCSADSLETAESYDILSALDDAVMLGADVINLSFGCHDSNDNSFNDSMNDAFSRISKSGVTLVTALCDDGKTKSDDKILRVDNGNISEFSSSSSVLSVASAEGDKIYKSYLLCDGRKYCYTLPQMTYGQADYSFRNMKDCELDYIVVPNNGEVEDYQGLDVVNKVAFVEQGGISFEEKVQNAYDNGAAAVVIYGEAYSDEDTVKFNSRPMLPCAIVDNLSTENLKQENGKIKISSAYYDTEDNADKNKISENSPKGPTSRLQIKPDIVDIGGVYSCTVDNKYGFAEGTSFASSQIAGAVACLKSYMNSNGRFKNLTNAERSQLAYQLLMSTAHPTIVEGDVYTSPAVQGAGMANLSDALNADAFLSVENGLPKIELGDSESGEYEFDIEVSNISDKDIAYDIFLALQSKNYNLSEKTIKTIRLDNSYADIKMYANGSEVTAVSVPKGESKKIRVKIKLNEFFVLSEKLIHQNGFYVEGYISFLPKEEGKTALSAPILGLCGSWFDQSAFGETIYDEKTPLLTSPVAGEKSYLYVSEQKTSEEKPLSAILGYNKFLKIFDKDNISFNNSYLRNLTNDSSLSDAYLFADIVTLRNLSDFNCIIKNQNGEVVFKSNSMNKLTKTDEEIITCINTGLSGLPNGKYTMTVSGKTNKTTTNLKVQSLEFSFTVDSKKPEKTSYRTYMKDGRVFLEFSGKDNNAIQGFDIYAAVFNEKTQKYEYSNSIFDLINNISIPIYGDTISLVDHSTDKEGITRFTYDITNLRASLKKLAKIYGDKDLSISVNKVAFAAVDYANNVSEIRLADTVVYSDLELNFIDADGKGISGIRVNIDGNEQTSNGDGKVVFSKLAGGEYKAEISSLPNGLSVEHNKMTVSVTGDKSADTITVDVRSEGYFTSVSPGEENNEQDKRPNKSNKGHAAEQKPSNEINPEEIADDTESSIYVAIIIAIILAASITAFAIAKKKSKF